MQILHLRHHQIDSERWDSTIASAQNSTGYAFTWYLNIVSPGWEALISDDYKYVMPLPVKRKFGIPYLVQPIYTQQLGVFSTFEITFEIIQLFINKIPYYSYQINLNEHNVNFELNQELNILPNFVLHLNKPFKDLQSAFSKNTIRNIEKAKKEKLTLDYNTEIEEFLNFYYSVEKRNIINHVNLLEELLKSGLQRQLMKLIGIRNANGDLIAELCILISDKRIIYLAAVSNSEGKKVSAMFFLMNEIIKAYSKKDILLDFEGSSIEGIARFYKGFGAVNQPYCVLKKFRPDFLVGKI